MGRRAGRAHAARVRAARAARPQRRPRSSRASEAARARLGREPFTARPNIVDVYVSQLRRKLERSGRPRVIHTVRGVGFRLEPDEAPFRARLTAWNVLVLAAIIVGLGAFVALRLRDDLTERVDRSLDARNPCARSARSRRRGRGEFKQTSAEVIESLPYEPRRVAAARPQRTRDRLRGLRRAPPARRHGAAASGPRRRAAALRPARSRAGPSASSPAGSTPSEAATSS